MVLVDLLARGRDPIPQDLLDLDPPPRVQNLPRSVDPRDGAKKIPPVGPMGPEARSEAIEEKEATEAPGRIDPIDLIDLDDPKKDLATIQEAVVIQTAQEDRSLIRDQDPLPVAPVAILAEAFGAAEIKTVARAEAFRVTQNFVPVVAQPEAPIPMPRGKSIRPQRPTLSLNVLFVPIFQTMKCAILAKIPAWPYGNTVQKI